ncbi:MULTISPECIES: 4-hydroxy-tetrahydrodipicolinate synthase [Paenibacillus]|uniref:4-hydroxy-tetrahydrodipicolinate synthase n=1 Tax=Paenibacillus albilobatus TaxID=2716884 RepID=A0A919XC52_9BACL|nr:MULTISPECIES: 4-hydroxy-tetrahydrodipicolinate synthase [Paenibacillus]GIO29446.1 4-hydroxy-tetrahydrodipicolinate synthase 2 [Paenibacillus albilobatus]
MLKREDLQGVFVPVVTPFTQDGELDLVSYQNYAGQLVEHGIAGLVVNGTTGEAPTVRWEEVRELAEATRTIVKNKKRALPVVIGTGTNDTASTVERTESAANMGADAVLVVVPYYSKPSQEGILEHFRSVVQVGIPVIAYEIPSRTGVRLSMDTARAIMELDGVIGIKDSSDSLELIGELTRHNAGPVLCGDDPHYFAKLALGASGGILASANVNTQRFIDIFNHVQKGDSSAAKQIFEDMLPLIQGLFREPNPAPLKWMLASLGRIASDRLRLPLMPISEQLKNELKPWLHYQ